MDNLAMDVRDAVRLGYGCHYGHFKADHPETKERNLELAAKKPPKPPKPPKLHEIVCENCGAIFRTTDKRLRYCDANCQWQKNQKRYKEKLERTKAQRKGKTA